MTSKTSNGHKERKDYWKTLKETVRPHLGMGMALLVLAAAITILRIATEMGLSLIRDSQIIPREETATVVQLDLLQLLGFLLAWTLALITISALVTKWALKMQSVQQEIAYLKEALARSSQEEEKRTLEIDEKQNELLRKADDIEKRHREEVQNSIDENQRVLEENSRLKEENKRISKFLAEESRKYLY